MRRTANSSGSSKVLSDKRFMESFEGKVHDTIAENKLIKNRDRVLVAVSGGKDSTTALYLLHKFGYDVEGLIIDQLLGEHSKTNLRNITEFCKANDIKLHVVHMRDVYGCSVCYMKSVLDGKGIVMNSCTICGVVRRNILNKKAREIGATVLATGHNMDDEAQTMLMNFIKGDMGALARMGPKSGVKPDERFIPRVKPLFLCLEADVKRYSQLMGFPVVYEPCPCSLESYRTEIKKYLNGMEEKEPGTKESMLRGLLKVLPRLKKRFKGSKLSTCEACGEPSSNRVCRACVIMGLLGRTNPGRHA
jgi:tRNA-5-methyluridine54 2-sulfurtransferase